MSEKRTRLRSPDLFLPTTEATKRVDDDDVRPPKRRKKRKHYRAAQGPSITIRESHVDLYVTLNGIMSVPRGVHSDERRLLGSARDDLGFALSTTTSLRAGYAVENQFLKTVCYLDTYQLTKKVAANLNIHASGEVRIDEILGNAYEYIVYLKGRVKDLEDRLQNTRAEEAARKLYELLPYAYEAPEESGSE